MSVYIDGRYYYSPCSKCKENSCYSCTLSKYKEDLQKEISRRTSAEFRISNELEPRIKMENQAYDNWVTYNTGERECECFSQLIEELIDFVEDNKKYMEWDDPHGDLEQKILFLIRNRVDDNLFYIEEKVDV